MSSHRPVCMVPKKTSLWGSSEHTEGSMDHLVILSVCSGCVLKRYQFKYCGVGMVVLITIASG